VNGDCYRDGQPTDDVLLVPRAEDYARRSDPPRLMPPDTEESIAVHLPFDDEETHLRPVVAGYRRRGLGRSPCPAPDEASGLVLLGRRPERGSPLFIGEVERGSALRPRMGDGGRCLGGGLFTGAGLARSRLLAGSIASRCSFTASPALRSPLGDCDGMKIWRGRRPV